MLNIIAGSLSVGVTPSTNSYESISTVTVGSGGASNIEFTSIPSTYTHLQLRLIARSSDAPLVTARYNSDTTTSNYYAHRLYGGSGTGSIATSSNAYIAYLSTAGNSANEFSVAITDILDYANTNKYKTIRSLAGNDQNGGGYVILFSHLWMSTSAITSIKLAPATGNFEQYSQIALYGIKGS